MSSTNTHCPVSKLEHGLSFSTIGLSKARALFEEAQVEDKKSEKDSTARLNASVATIVSDPIHQYCRRLYHIYTSAHTQDAGVHDIAG
ncbi:hypothetical protein RvY_18013 [Ramazzottius varieornatus]|uniref:Uncharacterized protein n=1 Tax=Ramazzottius varieornatus TaxID=947166 RepID=A0A1D1W7U6_RAMVA|nr:hypothetical protein RvY_18013 [Ramazzottius varieornatus]